MNEDITPVAAAVVATICVIILLAFTLTGWAIAENVFGAITVLLIIGATVLAVFSIQRACDDRYRESTPSGATRLAIPESSENAP